ncbi:MAG: circadian clock KaiB family protein [Synechococcaceae cyanobacterium ELA263]
MSATPEALPDPARPTMVLTLYISGASPRSSAALMTIRRICDEELAGRVELNVVDIRSNPAALVQDHVLAVPVLIRRWPEPLRHIVGDLANAERVRAALDLAPLPLAPESGRPTPQR